MAITKPPVDLIIWGSGATSSPDMVTPGAGMFSSGFVAPPTKPTRGHMNHLLNKLHSAIRYFSSRSITDWDASESQYAVGSLVWYATTGRYYRLTTASPTGAAPSADTAHWADAFILPGQLLGTTRIVSGSGTIAVIPGCRLVRVKLVAGGGGGGGANPNDAPTWTIIGCGGSAGGQGEIESTTIPAVSFSYAVGAGGAAGVAGGVGGTAGNGGAGGNSTFSDGTGTVTCFGGPGGTTSAGAVGNQTAAPALSTITGGGTMTGIMGSGEPGQAGVITQNGATAIGGRGGGGSSQLFGGSGGRAGAAAGVDAPGNNGIGPGAGGGGAYSNGGGAIGAGGAGGAGTAGAMLVEQYA